MEEEEDGTTERPQTATAAVTASVQLSLLMVMSIMIACKQLGWPRMAIIVGAAAAAAAATADSTLTRVQFTITIIIPITGNSKITREKVHEKMSLGFLTTAILGQEEDDDEGEGAQRAKEAHRALWLGPTTTTTTTTTV